MNQDNREKYDELARRLQETSRLGSIMGILHWDQEVIMPPGAAESRARQMAALAGVLHEKATDPSTGKMLDQVEEAASDEFNEHEWCNIREARRDYDRETKIPASLVSELAELSSNAHHIWARAREQNSFEVFAPALKRLIQLKIEWAGHVDPDQAPYDVNMDVFERDSTMDRIDPLFDQLKTVLIPLIHSIQQDSDKEASALLKGHFPKEKQEALGRQISRDMGFDFDRGRIDVSVHPFCGGAGSADVRITTRYREDNFVESLYAMIHETGHGLYEQGRMKEWPDLPVSEALSMGIHESQSLFWERMVAQNRAFLKHYLPLVEKTFGLEGSLDEFYRGINRVEPSFIRVEADEVTYPLHVVLRYEIEKGLFDGSLSVESLPDIWNQKMQDYLGIRPETDTLGVLQDVHWSGGAFGYFPSYTLGAMYACQFYLAMKRENPEVEEGIARGEFQPIRSWLNENIHSRGRLYSSEELCRKVTGENLNADHFVSYLRAKYGELYSLEAVSGK